MTRSRTASLCICVLLAASLALATPAVAQEESEEEGRNAIGLYLGVTEAGGETGPSIGVEYERRLSRRFGVGGVVEHTGADFRENIVAVSFAWHPSRWVKLFAAPGVAIETEEESVGWLLRLGGHYGFSLGKGFEAAPGIAVDFSNHETAVLVGALFSKKF